MSEHNIVLETGYEYDENGNVCGQWGQEVCSKCGERTDLMNSNPECPVEDD
jgi:hypothetical protein